MAHDFIGLPGGRFVASWQNRAWEPSGYGYYTDQPGGSRLQVFDANGRPVSAQLQIGGPEVYDVKMEPLLGGGFMVITHRMEPLEARWQDVIGQRFDGRGNAIGEVIQVLPREWNFDYNFGDVDLIALNDGGFVVTWMGQEKAVTPFVLDGFEYDFEADYYAQRFGPGGSPLGDPFTVNNQPPNHQFSGHAAVLEDGRFLGVWADANLDQIGGQFFETFDGVVA